MRRRIALALLSGVALVVAFYLAYTQGGLGGCEAYFSLMVPRCVTLVFFALAAGTLISAGQVDISSGAVMSLFGTFAIYVSNHSSGSISLNMIAILAFPCFLALYGCYAFALWRVPRVSSLIVTLGVLFVFRGASEFVQIGAEGMGPLSNLLNPDHTIGLLTAPLKGDRTKGQILMTQWLYVCMLMGVIFAMHFWRYRTRSGLQHVSLGENRLASLRAGVRRGPVLGIAFAIAGGLVYCGALNEFFAVRLTSWSVQDGRGFELLAIAAAVIGGARIEGGRLDPISVVLAAIFVMLVDGAVKKSSLPSETVYLVTGLALTIAAFLDGMEQTRIDGQSKLTVTSDQ